MCACIRTSAEDDNFLREGGRCVIPNDLNFGFGLSDITLFQVILGLLGIRSMLWHMETERKGVHV